MESAQVFHESALGGKATAAVFAAIRFFRFFTVSRRDGAVFFNVEFFSAFNFRILVGGFLNRVRGSASVETNLVNLQMMLVQECGRALLTMKAAMLFPYVAFQIALRGE